MSDDDRRQVRAVQEGSVEMADEGRKCKRGYESRSFDLHLCYNEAQGFYLTDRGAHDERVADPRFRCGHCGQLAHWHGNLCVPQRVDDPTDPEPGQSVE